MNTEKSKKNNISTETCFPVWFQSVAMIEEAHDIAESPGEEGATGEDKPRIDPSKMTVSRSRQQVITSDTKTTKTTVPRNKTPTRKK